MTIKTLTFIHNLLKEEANKRSDALRYMRETVTKARCENAPNVEYLEKQQDLAWEKSREAERALEDFEDQEF